MDKKEKYVKKRLDGLDRVELKPGVTVYNGDEPLTVKDVYWFGDYAMDVVLCSNGRSYPATDLYRLIPAAV